MSNALDKNYSKIVDNKESVEEKDEKLLKIANETHTREAPFVNEKVNINHELDLKSCKTFVEDFKSFVMIEGLTSRTKAPAKIETIPTFIDVVEHIPEDKMPVNVYFIVPDLTVKNGALAQYRYINMNYLPEELKRVINATLNFTSHGSDKRMLVDYCKSLLESVEKINT